MTKTVSPSKFQEWKGLDRIQVITHEMKCVYRELQKDDYGIDGEIEVVVPKSSGEGYEATGGILKFQSKSGKSYIVENKKDSFSVKVEKSDLENWHRANFPTLFFIYHPEDDKTYFTEVKEYIRQTPDIFKAPYKISFKKKKNEFTVASFEKLREIASSSPARVSRGDRERLYSNLLPVKKLPNLITYAPTDYIDRDEVFAEARKVFPNGFFLAPFFIKENKLYTLDDLRNHSCSLRRFCNTKNINDDSAEQWAKDAVKKADFLYLLNQLLGNHLRKCGLVYNRDYKRNYFPRQNDTSPEFLRRWHNVRTRRDITPRIVAKFYEYGRDKFWRHTALSIHFKQIGEAWFLQIVPRYFFTEDGETPCDGKLVGPYTTGIKARERNLKVLNDILFWSDVLSQSEHEIELKLHQYKLVAVERMPLSEIARFAIPNDPAVYEDEEEQSDFFQIWESAENAEENKTLYFDERIRDGVGEIDEY